MLDCLVDIGNGLVEIASEIEVLCNEIQDPKMHSRVLLFLISFESLLFF